MSTLDLKANTKAVAPRRIEVISGVERRRRWSDDEKARVLDETMQPGAVISDIARRNGLSPQQVFTWRRQARRAAIISTAGDVPSFVPVAIEAGPHASTSEITIKPAPVLELEIAGSSVWVWREAHVDLVTAVVRALKSAR